MTGRFCDGHKFGFVFHLGYYQNLYDAGESNFIGSKKAGSISSRPFSILNRVLWLFQTLAKH